MLRVFVAALFGAGLVGLATLPAGAQDKKEKPKAPPRIAINEPEKLKDDADFATQGEYVGEVVLNEGKTKVGAQVVAKGEGKFAIKVLIGGLPGAGWDGKTAMVAEAKRGEDGAVAVTGKELSGSIVAGKLMLKDGMKIDTSLAKTERTSTTMGAKPPEGAIVLFGKPGDEANWNGGKIVELSDGKYLGVGVTSMKEFGAFQAHVEFRLPWMPNSSGQGRGNSGVYLQNRYEVQVLDSFGLKGENNECGGIYTMHKPSVNMCLPPMLWQTYDIAFTPAEFGDDGKRTKPGRTTIRHNGVTIHDDVELTKESGGGQAENSKPGPFQLQNHGDPLVYRNIWVVEMKK